MQSTKTTIIITTAILILTLLTAGCTDTGGANPETPKYMAPLEEVPVVEETETAVEDTPEPVEAPWYEIEERFENVEVGTYSTMFGLNIDGVKYPSANGGYSLYNKNEFLLLLHHSEFDASYPLHNELSPDQYRTLIDQYGSMISVTMETIDLDQDGAMDKVAVKYVGTKSEWTEKFNHDKRAHLSAYIVAHISPDEYPTLII